MRTSLETAPFEIRNPATGKPLRLAMQELRLLGRLSPVGADLRVQHVFRSAERRPVEVVYAFGLPRDAALRRFRIRGEGFAVDSELKPTRQAEADYEKAIEEGRLASLARSYRDGVVNLAVGNLRPGETVWVDLEILAGVDLRDDGWRFRFPFTLAPAYHPKARAIESRPGVGELELPEEFEGVILPPWLRDANDLHRVGFELWISSPTPVRQISSPSHRLSVEHGNEEAEPVVSLATESDVPDRDLVIDVKLCDSLSGVVGGAAPDGAGGFAVIVPSTQFGRPARQARRVVFVLDRSGSMSGAPIAQARRAVEACLGALAAEDRFGIVAFDTLVETMASSLQAASLPCREEAGQWLETIDARGGTELLEGIRRGIELLGPEGGELLVLTDGQVFGTEDVLAGIPQKGVRIHCLGIGSASQDRFLTLLARRTGGQCRFLTPRERVDVAVLELFANIGGTVAEEVTVELTGGSGCRLVLPPPPAVFDGTPLVLHGEAEAPTTAWVTLRWKVGGQARHMEFPVELNHDADAAAVRLLQGARLITEAESAAAELASPEGVVWTEAERRLIELSKRYGLASRAMALVAVVKRRSDQPGGIPQTVVVPVGMPEDVDFGAYFQAAQHRVERCVHAPAPPDGGTMMVMPLPPLDTASEGVMRCESPAAEPLADVMDVLMELAGRLEPDGGLPGPDEEGRWLASAVLLAALLAVREQEGVGAFDRHIERLKAFLEASPVTAGDPRKREWLDRLLEGDRRPSVSEALLWELIRGGTVAPAKFWRALGR